VEAERRQVTVLFADMVGFTSVSERSGEEAAFTLMRSLSKLMGETARNQGSASLCRKPLDRGWQETPSARPSPPSDRACRGFRSTSHNAEQAVRALVAPEAASASLGCYCGLATP